MTTDLHTAARQALEALEYHTQQTRPIERTEQAVEHLRAALAAAPSTSPAAAPSVEAVEDEVGMGHAAWDTISPESIIAAVYKLASPAEACTCPSGDGSLRWPCPAHPRPAAPALAPPGHEQCPGGARIPDWLDGPVVAVAPAGQAAAWVRGGEKLTFRVESRIGLETYVHELPLMYVGGPYETGHMKGRQSICILATGQIVGVLTQEAPAPAVERGVADAPNPGSPEASAMIDSVLAEYGWPSNTKNAARAGYVAAMRLMGGLSTAGKEQA